MPHGPVWPAAFLAGAALLLGVSWLSLAGRVAPGQRAVAPRHRALIVHPNPVAKPTRQQTAALRSTSALALERSMTAAQLLNRWNADIAAASRRFHVPLPWIRAVMIAESGGRTLSDDGRPLISSTGALGLMQLMPKTYRDMREQYGLGRDPQNPHDNIFAGAAYLRQLYLGYGYPAMFSAYNDGPGNLVQRLRNDELLPDETRSYAADITRVLTSGRGLHGIKTKFTRPDGTAVFIDASSVVAIRAPLAGEYAPGVRSVITSGKMHQGVRESVVAAKAILRAHGGGV